MSDVAEAVQPQEPGPVSVDVVPNTEEAEQATADDPKDEANDAEVTEATEKSVQDVDQELEAMKRRLQQMEAESLTLKPDDTTPSKSDGQDSAPATPATTTAGPQTVPNAGVPAPAAAAADEAIADADSRSIYVGNVDYNATVDELSAYFSECGTINRVTIMTHKPTGQPKGFAYVEFKDQHAVQNAMILNESMFKGRQLKIVPKRTNVPGMARGGYRGRGRFARGRGGYYYGRRPRPRGRGRWVPY